MALDIGASTGGFTQVLLERGAAHVTAIDVGHGQIDPQPCAPIRASPSIEGLNARDLTAADLGGARPDFLVCDVSFISLTLALPPALGLAAPGARGVFLVKPQFEAGREAIGKGGMLKRPGRWRRAIAEALRAWLDALPGWRALGLHPSPIAGGDGNREFLLAGIEGPVSGRFEIARLGAQGDGVAETETGPVFVPFALPGETVHRRARRRTAPTLIVDPAAVAASASSRPAGISATCGGCAIQHLEDARLSRLEARQGRAGAAQPAASSAEVADIVACAPQTRRRVAFSRAARPSAAWCSATTGRFRTRSSTSRNARSRCRRSSRRSTVLRELAGHDRGHARSRST